jgi:hypothetical protein
VEECSGAFVISFIPDYGVKKVDVLAGITAHTVYDVATMERGVVPFSTCCNVCFAFILVYW